MMGTIYARILMMLLWLGLAASAATAAQIPDEGTPEAPQRAERLIKMFLDHATTELNLTVEQRAGLEVALRETMARRGELTRGQFQLRRQIGEALANPSSGDDEFLRLSEASLALKRKEVELLHWQQQRLLQVLTPRQSLRFMLLQEGLAQRIEAMRRERRR